MYLPRPTLRTEAYSRPVFHDSVLWTGIRNEHEWRRCGDRAGKDSIGKPQVAGGGGDVGKEGDAMQSQDSSWNSSPWH